MTKTGTAPTPGPPRNRQQPKCLIFALGLFLLLIGCCLLVPCDSKISNQRRCFDEKCSVVISKGLTMRYISNDKDPRMLSLQPYKDVKIYSKEAGDRLDLWGVEVEGQRGYAPRTFIREQTIFKVYKDLNYTVPTEEITEEIKESIEDLSEIVSDEIIDSAEDLAEKSALDENNNSFIDSQEVFPSYESVYDGTIIPQDLEKEETPQTSYSTQTLQDSVKKDEEIQLNVYPNILTSTFSAISGILGSNEPSTEDSIEITPSEAVVTETPIETTPKIEKQDEVSLNTEEKENLSELALLKSGDKSKAEEPSLEPKISKDFDDSHPSIPANEPIDSSEVSEKLTTDSATQDENQTLTFSTDEKIEDNVIETLISTESDNDIKSDSTIEDEKQNMIDINEIKKVKDDEEANEISKSAVESEKSLVAADDTVEEKVEVISNENNTVPKPEEVVSTTIDSLNIDNNVEPSLENEILDKKIVDLNDTENIVKVEATVAETITTTTEVPLQSEIIEEAILTTSESLEPKEELSSNDSLPSLSNENFNAFNATETSLPIEESKPVIDESVSLQKQIDIGEVEDNNNVTDANYTTNNVPIHVENDSDSENVDYSILSTDSNQKHIVDIPPISVFNEFLGNQNLLNAAKASGEVETNKIVTDKIVQSTISSDNEESLSNAVNQNVDESISKEITPTSDEQENISEEMPPPSDIEKIVLPPETCEQSFGCLKEDTKHQYSAEQNAVTSDRKVAENSETLLYIIITAVTTLMFSLGYYFIENRRRDAYLIEKINKLEKDLMITRKECIMLDDNFKSTKTKLDSIEDESFGSNEMVLSLKAELAASENVREELKEQIISLERELESASEAGLELERMLREILASQSEENNPLAQSIQDLQDRLNDQQDANVSLTNALALKNQENETLSGDLSTSLKKIEHLQASVDKLSKELRTETNLKIDLEQTLCDQVQKLEIQVQSLSDDKTHLHKQLKMKELEIKELLEVVEQLNSNSFDFEKLCETSHIKAEVAHLRDERDELKMKLSEEEGAHQLLEEHVKVVKEEVAFLSDQCKAAEKEKKDAETRLEVLTKFFEEKEAQRQKEEAVWLEKQGEVSSTVERIQTMQNELLNYKQQIEMLKHEILDQEREYKNQIAALETKAHEHWVAARQNERRLEEVKAESSQLRNRLTLVEKNINDTDPEVKLHRLQQQVAANGETSHPLFPGMTGESSNSPLMFAGGSAGSMPLPPYLYGSVPPPPGGFPPPFLPPPPGPLPPGPGESAGLAGLVGSRPAPLGGGRLSSPPPPGRSGSPPPLSPPPLLPHHGFAPPPPHHHHMSHHRHQHHPLHSPPPLPPYASDVPPPPPPHMMMPPPPLHTSSSTSTQQQQHRHQQQSHYQQQQQPQSQQQQQFETQDGVGNWSNDSLSGPRPVSAFHSQQQQQRTRNHKGSLHSSGESLDKSYGGKV